MLLKRSFCAKPAACNDCEVAARGSVFEVLIDSKSLDSRGRMRQDHGCFLREAQPEKSYVDKAVPLVDKEETCSSTEVEMEVDGEKGRRQRADRLPESCRQKGVTAEICPVCIAIIDFNEVFFLQIKKIYRAIK